MLGFGLLIWGVMELTLTRSAHALVAQLYLGSGIIALAGLMATEDGAVIVCRLIAAVFGLLSLVRIMGLPTPLDSSSLSMPAHLTHLAIAIACVWIQPPHPVGSSS